MHGRVSTHDIRPPSVQPSESFFFFFDFWLLGPRGSICSPCALAQKKKHPLIIRVVNFMYELCCLRHNLKAQDEDVGGHALRPTRCPLRHASYSPPAPELERTSPRVWVGPGMRRAARGPAGLILVRI